MGNFNKFDKFPLMECVQKRVIMWNEPNFEPGEEILKLFWRRRNEREADDKEAERLRTQSFQKMQEEIKVFPNFQQVEQGASLGNGEIDNEYEEGTKNSLPKTSGAYTEAEAEEATKVSDET
ncbi:Putative non-capsid protein NS-1 [Eumeta japonica]|uniref:Non-capsid protein NS-1 n=1 Tax=Eumeta variegata TaxID=151549 RepID=A0A4C1Z3Q6_EUMVA|nr:Putative non-capsid protein NS-1 [Eumeta japonica]